MSLIIKLAIKGEKMDMNSKIPLKKGMWTIKTNGEWGQFCYDAEVYAGSLGNLNTYLRVRWTFANSGYPLRLVGANNERLEVVLNDDFSLNNGSSDPLVEQYFVVQGYFESNE